MITRIFVVLLSIFIFCQYLLAQQAEYDAGIARLKYDGGGDWYSNPTSLPNLLKALKQRIGLRTPEKEATVTLDTQDLNKYPLIYMTGHGNVKFSPPQINNLRNYLKKGGFLWADDNYGMNKSFRAQISRAFPESKLVELPFSHNVFKSYYEFKTGLPKIHEHDGGPPQCFGLFISGRLSIIYTFNTDIGDGLENPDVHNDPPEKREEALKMAINIILYCLNN